ncbi:DeoR/GlpR family DNA-binding transcription regulator [Priestia megaterium]|uniref:DeoR/GlpR family DNA-binding transcription regulator n=1 Tax=Priestia megaterium TaxID=1404 RepID=UPI00244D2A5F|nr:DeoR/GlpR family DNA-binding transcription regulator [Priestia megaterium]MDH2363169.1 DeoR/GlpR family DNA-binding transcription regulator [Priestia megaterium]
MLQDERLEAILLYLKDHERITIETVCEINDVSRDTARRYLIKLEELGKIVRIRGGAKKLSYSKELYDYNQRLNMASTVKEKIGEYAASLLKDGESLILDASTTVQFAAKYIKTHNHTIVTNSINVVNELVRKENIKINILGGTLDHQHQAIYGSRAIKDIQEYKVDKCIIGTCGISEEGLSTSIEEEGLLLKEMIGRSQQTILLADSSKFNKTFFQKVCDLELIDTLITNEALPSNLQKELNRHSVEVIDINNYFQN